MQVLPLAEKDIDEGVKLILDEFEPNQPLTCAFASKYPELRLSEEERRQLWKHWITVSIEKQLILGLYDTQKENRLVGLSICKDINYNLPEIEEDYSNSLTEEKCFLQLEESFLLSLDEPIKSELKKEGVALEIMIMVVAKQYQGRGLSRWLIGETQKLLGQYKFKYIYCQASNFRTAKSLIWNGFTKLMCIDLKEFRVDQEKPFENIQEEDRYPTTWIKPIV